MKLQLLINFIIITFLSPAWLAAQDITGLWKGEMYVDSVKLHLPYEILISESKGKLIGYSRVIFFKDGIQGGMEEPGIQDISIKQKGDIITIEDEGFLEHNFSIKPPKQVKKTMVLTLTTSDSDMVMRGSWSTNRTKYYLVATGTATLKRKNDYKQTALYKRLDTLKLTSKLIINSPVTNPIIITAATNVPVIKNEVAKAEVSLPEPEPELPAKRIASFLGIPFKKNQPVMVAKIKAPGPRQSELYKSITVVHFVNNSKPITPVTASAVVLPVNPKPKPIKVVEASPAPAQNKELAASVGKPPKPVSVPVAFAPAAKTVVAPTKTPATVVSTSSIAENKTEAIVTAPSAALPKTLPVAVATPSALQGAAELDKRAILNEQSFFFESDSLVLTLYDNGDVDGDTVTVVMNGNVIFSKQGLSTRANTKTIQINPTSDSIKLVMYAENLGEIPPNTGLLVVMDGEKRYDVRFTADLKSNAAITLKRRKKQL